jgi:hypothetical protein
MSVTTSSTQTTITVEYNISYTVTVGVNTVCAEEATGTIYIGESGLGGRGSECNMCWSAGGPPKPK